MAVYVAPSARPLHGVQMMQDSSVWSVSFGRWGGVQVRLHALFLLFGIFTVYLSTRTPHPDLVWYAAMSLGILFLSVLLHELAHCLMAFRVGGHAEEIVIGPFGGLAQVHVPHEPQSELFTALAGPTVNLLICLIAIPLLAFVGEVDIVGLLHPLRPLQLVEGTVPAVALKLTFWLNWILVLLNLLPAFPFDGGRVLRALLWPMLGYRPAAVVVAQVAKVAAFGFCLGAWWIHEPNTSGVVPLWLPLVLIAVFLFFSAKQEVARGAHEDSSDELFGYDFSQGYTSLEREEEISDREEPGFFQRWIEQRRLQKEQRMREIEEAEESRVDDILAQLHTKGMEGLSAEDRALLRRVSERYRNRQQS